MNKIYIAAGLTAILLLAAGCKSSQTEEEMTPEPMPPAQTGGSQEGMTGTDMVSIFSTSDWAQYERDGGDDYGYFFTSPQIGPFSMIEGEFKKLGGYEKSAFGFVFSYTADEEGWLSDYMRFEINTSGEYGLYTYDGRAIYTDLVEPQGQNEAYLYESDLIRKGYDTANTLKIAENGDGSCSVYINGTEVAQVPLVHERIGKVMPFFSVGKADQEKLPEEPVIVTYRITGSEPAS